MKLFSLAWKSSSKAAKQRKYRLNAPLHLKGKFLSASLMPGLRERFGSRSLAIREGDTVRVMKGEFSGLAGKINKINLKAGTVFVDGAERVRKDGTKSFFPLQPSSLLVTEANLEDKLRAASLSRKPGPSSKKPANARERKGAK